MDELISLFPKSRVVFNIKTKNPLMINSPIELNPHLVTADEHNVYCFVEFCQKDITKIENSLELEYQLSNFNNFKKKEILTKALGTEIHDNYLFPDKIRPLFEMLEEKYSTTFATAIINLEFDCKTKINNWHMNRPEGYNHIMNQFGEPRKKHVIIIFSKKKHSAKLINTVKILQTLFQNYTLNIKKTEKYTTITLDLATAYSLLNPDTLMLQIKK